MVYGVKRREDSDNKDIVPAAKIVYDPSCIDEDILYETVQKDIDMINAGMPSYKNLHRFELTDVPMEKTTTGKIKRYVQK
jgi:long-chain acyl-CoA synthetase